MSAPAIKSSMPGVGTPTASTGHTMLPMNMVAQKVVPSTDQTSGSMKPLQSTNLNYVTLQPPSQPLSLIQEHRAPTSYQTPFTNNIPTEQQPPPQQQQQQQQQQPQQQPPQHKEQEQTQQPDPSKLVQNGMEQSKVEKDKQDGLATTVPFSTTPAASATISSPGTAVAPAPLAPSSVTPTPIPTASGLTNVPASVPTVPATTVTVPVTAPVVDKPVTEQPKVNSSSVDGPVQDRHQETEVTPKPKEEIVPVKPEQQITTSVTQNKVEEKKSPITSGPKEDSVATTVSPQKTPQQTVSQKSEETPSKVEATITQKSPKIQPPKAAESPDKLEPKTPVSSRPVKRKSRELKEPKGTGLEGGPRSKRNRVQTTPYQSPLPEIAMIVKNLSKPSPKGGDDKLIVFYKNEFLAVRNTEGSFYVCQAMQNIYKSSKRIRIRWLSQDKNNGEIYSPDFYDFTDFDCILTNLNLNKVEKNKYQLTKYELLRTENILKRAIDVEAGVSEKPRVTEEHPDGLDLSLYKDEAQLKKRKGKNKGGKGKGKRQRKKSNKNSSESEDDDDDDETDEENDDSDESSTDSESSKTGSPSARKASQLKKRSGSKAAIAQGPATPKGPSRAERALNRSKGAPAGPSTAGTAGSSPAASTSKKVEPKKAAEPKKVPAKPTVSTSLPGQSRAKARGAPAQTSTQETKATGGRPKRVSSATTATASSSEESSSRKKPRGRA